MSGRAVDEIPMPGAYFWLVLRRVGVDPAVASRLTEGTGIDPSAPPRDEIRLGQLLRLIRNLAGELGPAFGLELGRFLDAASHGVLGVATASAPTLGDALSVIERFAHVRAPYFRLHCLHEDDRFVLRVEPQLGLEAGVWRPLVEMLFLSIQALVESSLGRPMHEAHFEFQGPAPGYVDRYSEVLHAPVRFDQPSAAVVGPLSWLPVPCPFADRALHRGALDRLEAAERRLQGEEFIVAQVERILEGAGDAGLELPAVASALHLSQRTLVRRLAARDTSFRAILDARRRERARALLADPELSVAEIADRLGYTEPANFGRACRRWFGTGPRAARTRVECATS
jgi:AraC-like DNA-binding protein